MDELIWRSDAIKAITGEPIDAHYPSWYVDKLKEVPPVEKKVVIKMDAVATDLTFMPNKSVGKWEERSVFEESNNGNQQDVPFVTNIIQRHTFTISTILSIVLTVGLKWRRKPNR